jgi:hypothetical protein
MNIDINFNIKNLYLKNSKKYYLPKLNIQDVYKKSNNLYNLYAGINHYLKKQDKIKLNIFNNNDNKDFENLNSYIISTYELYNNLKNDAIQQEQLEQLGGGIGGHAGDIIFIKGKIYKRLDERKLYKLNKNNNIIKTHICIEAFIYLFFLKILYEKMINNANKNKYDNIINIAKYCSTINKLNLENYRDRSLYNLLKQDNYIIKQNNIFYFNIGNLKKKSENNILDYKLGCYTVNRAETNINSFINNNSADAVQTGGYNAATHVGLHFNDSITTSSYFGFRCEGVDNLFNTIFKKWLFLSINNNITLYLNSWNIKIDKENDIDVYLDDDMGTDDERINISKSKYYTKKNKSVGTYKLNPDKGIFLDNGNEKLNDAKFKKFKKHSSILLNKNKILSKLLELLSTFTDKLVSFTNHLRADDNKKDNILLKLKYYCLIHHYTYINYFDYDNKVLSNMIYGKTSLFNKAPNYFIPPLILFDTFYSKYTLDNKKQLQSNLDTLIEHLILNQYDAICNNSPSLCCAFVGSSLITNVDTQEIKLIDFGHPIFFNSTQLHTIDKDIFTNSKLSSDTYNNINEIYSIFMNFAHGALSYYFMLTMYLGIFDDNDNTKKIINRVIKYLYKTTYYTQSLEYGFPLIDNSANININTYMTNDIYITSLNNLKFAEFKSTVAPNDDILKTYILPSLLEEKLMTTNTILYDKIKHRMEDRCDRTKFSYIYRLLQILSNQQNNAINLIIKINKFK